MTFPKEFGHPRCASGARISEMAKRKRRSYTKEQKAAAVRAYKAEGNLSQVARDLDLSPSVLRGWVNQAEIDENGGADGKLTTDEREELTRLRRENRVLGQEREFLKKAAAFFAKENDPRSR